MNNEIKTLLIDFVDNLDIYASEIYNQLEEKNVDFDFITIKIKNAIKDFENILKTNISQQELIFEKKFINELCFEIISKEIISKLSSLKFNHFVQFQYSELDCGLASLSNVSKNKIKLIDTYFAFNNNFLKKRGISIIKLKEMLKKHNIDSKINRNATGIKHLINKENAILLISKTLKTYKDAHYITIIDNHLIDSELGITQNIEKYIANNKYKYILATLEICS